MPVVNLPSGRSFAPSDGETILDGALRCGIPLPYSCRTGRCATCKALNRNGATVALHAETGLSRAEQDAGWILTCVRTAQSDLDLNVEDLGDVKLSSPSIVPCRIASLQMLSSDVVRVMLRLPPTTHFTFRAGQYVELIGPRSLRRSYSIANAPIGDKNIELHIRHVPNGAMSKFWFEQAKVGDLLRLNGPLGTFFLRDVSSVDLIFLATGTGIAPVKSMLEDIARASKSEMPRSISVFWGGRIPEDLYWDIGSLSGLSYFPVLSQADESWAGKRGYVQTVLLTNQLDWQETRIYACGSENMIRDAHQLLLSVGLQDRHFLSDAFVAS